MRLNDNYVVSTRSNSLTPKDEEPTELKRKKREMRLNDNYVVSTRSNSLTPKEEMPTELKREEERRG